MEDPTSWNLLTSSLAVCDVSRKGEAWAFIVLQGLVSGKAGDFDKFVAIVDEIRQEGPRTGPSEALRIEVRLRQVVSISPLAEIPDPWGVVATSRFRSAALWREGKASNAKEAKDMPQRQKRRWWWPFGNRQEE